jgi:putative oxidoreductase
MPQSGVTSFPLEAGRSPFVSKGKSMKIAALIARYLLGLVFLVFGLNGFLHFIPMQPLPPGAAGQFVGALLASHYFLVVSALQLAGGVLLLVNRYVPLALVLLGPVVVNILLFHLHMDRRGLPLAIVVVILWGILFLRHRQYFSGIFVQRTA